MVPEIRHLDALEAQVVDAWRAEHEAPDGASGQGEREERGGEAERADDIVNPQDVKVETMRSRGAGGQHVNRTESAVRLTHLPTNITVSMQESRSQHQNRARAWEVLRARLLDRKLQADAASNRAMRRSQVASADRSERVRTYNFPQVRRAMSEPS